MLNHRFADRAKVGRLIWFSTTADDSPLKQDTLKISGAQVSPVEIENCLLDHPEKLISDVTVAGVSGGRTLDEKVPRAWIVLNSAGKKRGASVVIMELESWHQKNLSKYKWLRGGIEVVEEVFVFTFSPLVSQLKLTLSSLDS